jgi:hypothetical protein
MKKNNTQLIDKIHAALEKNEVCALSIKGEHQYAVMKWETYEDLKLNGSNRKIKKELDSEKEVKKDSSTDTNANLFDINDLPV